MNDQLIFRISLLALLAVFVAHRAYYSRALPPQEANTVEKMSTSPLTGVANIAAITALLSSIAFIFIPSLVAWASIPLPIGLRWAGFLVALMGFGLLEWSHRALADNWSEQPRLLEMQALVESGPYHWIRHPMYSAFLLILGATLLITANWLVGVAWLSSTGLSAIERIRFEETVMQERFGGAYLKYKQRTGRLLPRVSV